MAGVASGGVTDFLFHEYNALLCKADDVNAFTDNLISLLVHNDLRKQLSDNAKKTALSMNWNHIFDDLVNVYNSVINEKLQNTFKQTA